MLAAIVVGCGGQPGANQADFAEPVPSFEPLDPADQQALDECVQAAGFSAAEPEDPAWVSAIERCAAELGILDQVVMTVEEPVDPEQVKLYNDQLQSLTQCLQGGGWDYPNPVPGENGLLEQEDPMWSDRLSAPEQERFAGDLQDCGASAGIRIADDGDLQHAEGDGHEQHEHP